MSECRRKDLDLSTRIAISLEMMRPDLSFHRRMLEWLLPILQLFCNHHLFLYGQASWTEPTAISRN